MDIILSIAILCYYLLLADVYEIIPTELGNINDISFINRILHGDSTTNLYVQ